MIGLKTKMTTAIILAILSGMLLAGASYALFPNQPMDQMPIPKPSPSLLDQLSWAILWIGIALLISLTLVQVIRLTGKIRNRKSHEPLKII